MTSVFIVGSGWFGSEVAAALATDGHRVVGVAAPECGRRGGPDLLRLWASRAGTGVVCSDRLVAADVPAGTDMIIAAHSHAFIGRLTRARARAAVGYHPSLLPLHRGRDAVKWQSRMGDRVVGGTVYHLTDRVDGGPVALQRYAVVAPHTPASTLWRDTLAPMGLEMLREAAVLGSGRLPCRPQDDSVATWEPALDAAPVYRPELLELTAALR